MERWVRDEAFPPIPSEFPGLKSPVAESPVEEVKPRAEAGAEKGEQKEKVEEEKKEEAKASPKEEKAEKKEEKPKMHQRRRRQSPP